MVVNAPAAGLLADFEALAGPNFHPARIHPRVRESYEHAVEFQPEAWSRWSPLAYPGACVLMETVSGHIDPLKRPVQPLDTSRGMTSDVIQLIDPDTNSPRHARWLRRIAATGGVIYAGIYRVLQTGTGERQIRYIRAMKQTLHVYVDAEGALQTDHTFRFFRYRMLHLHHTISPG